MNAQIKKNREKFLNALRTGNYKKGTIRSDEGGYPIIETPEEAEGSCACAIMIELFDTPIKNGRQSTLPSRKALGITVDQCRYIQQELNDSPLTFPEIADRIEKEIFNK